MGRLTLGHGAREGDHAADVVADQVTLRLFMDAS
jgi:hypothetical protein